MLATPPSNAALLLPYALPYALYVGSAAGLSAWLSREAVCAVQITLSAAALLWAAPRMGSLRGPRSALHSLGLGALAGIAGAAVWIAGHDQFVPPGGEPWSPAYLALRALAVVGLVPWFEEQLMRGYVLRVAAQWDRARQAGEPQPWESTFHERSLLALDPRAITPLALALSSAIFALGHALAQWPVALLYGAAMALLYRARGDLAVCVAAHAATNAILLGYGMHTGRWAL